MGVKAKEAQGMHRQAMGAIHFYKSPNDVSAKRKKNGNKSVLNGVVRTVIS